MDYLVERLPWGIFGFISGVIYMGIVWRRSTCTRHHSDE